MPSRAIVAVVPGTCDHNGDLTIDGKHEVDKLVLELRRYVGDRRTVVCAAPIPGARQTGELITEALQLEVGMKYDAQENFCLLCRSDEPLMDLHDLLDSVWVLGYELVILVTHEPLFPAILTLLGESKIQRQVRIDGPAQGYFLSEGTRIRIPA